MDSTLRIFSETNSSSWLRKLLNSSSTLLFKASCRVCYIKQTRYHLDRDSRENGRFRWKNENPCLKNFFGVPSLKLSLGEVEKSQGFLEVKHSKYIYIFFHHVFSRSRYFWNYLLFSNRMSRNQDIWIWRFWPGSWKVTTSQPKNLKMGFFSSLPFASYNS